MKIQKKILALILTLALALSLAVPALAAEGESAAPASEGGITILYTNDVHTYINKDLTYSLVAAYRDTLDNVLLVDAGDHIQGTAYGGMDNGATIIELMNAANYDLATLGNHEFDYGMDGCMNAIAWADFPYVSCNFYHEENGVAGDSVLDSYKVFEVDGVKIAFIGITTPESFTKSTPAYFQDENGNYIYGIAGGSDGSALYAAVQKAIDEASAEADIVIALGHLGIDPSSEPWTSTSVIANTTGLDAFIDGHSHNTVPMEEVVDKDGNTVILTQTGCYLSALGQMTIAADGTITTELLTAGDLDGIEPNADVKAIEDTWITEVDEQLGAKIADTEIEFTINDAEGNRAIRTYETNLGDFNADAYYWYSNEVAGLDCDIAVMNGGGIRATAAPGDWTYKTCKTINPFGNVLCVVKVSGQAILDALEFGSRYTPDSENGGFLHVAGLTYEINTAIPNTVKTDDKSVWLEGPDAYRVTNVRVYNKVTGAYEPLDLNKIYTMAGTNYTLLNCGDGFNMFGDAEKVLDGTSEDYLAMAEYAKAFADTDSDGYPELSSANSPLASYEGYLLNYEDPTGAGRITIAFSPEPTEPEPSDPAPLADIPLENGDFENGTDNWTLSGFSSVAMDKWATNNTTNTLNLWLSDDEAADGSAAYAVTLSAGTYRFGFDLSGAESDSGLRYSVTAGDKVLVSGSETYTTSGWDAWTTYSTEEFTLSEETEVTFALSGTVPAGYWGNLDNLTLQGTGAIVADATPSVTAPIDVEKVSGLPEDFIMGMDISSVVSEFKSGVTYKDFDGNTIDNVTDFCKFLAECGVTHIRVRVWNDPFDASGNGYGGGNSDVRTAVQIAQGCAEAGLKLLVDFHYSDFWADPGKQQAPKAWADFSLDEKVEAIQKFTTDSLTKIAETGAQIAMVQVGNETTGGIAGESGTANMCTLFSAGSAAIRAFDSSIKVVIHVTNPEKSTMTTWAKNLADNNVDYDILATSYYPSWHGTLANLKSQLQAVQDTYGKEVMVAETSYAFTLADTDGHDNTIREGTNTEMMCETQYPFTTQGQANFLRDIIAAVSDAGGLGVYYWEPAWITVGDTTGLEGSALTEQKAVNAALWEKYGSGWASSYAAEYDPDDAGQWFGGSAVDNQAMFTADGTPVDSINVWKYVRTGTVSQYVTVESIANAEETIETGGSYTLPETVTVTYNKGSEEEAVAWNEADAAAIEVNTVGTYVVNGTVTLDPDFEGAEYQGDPTASVTYTLTVKAPNLIDADIAGFEVPDGSDYTIGGSGINLPATDDPKEGSHSMHWWSETAASGTVTLNEPITLSAGTYTFEAAAQGFAGDTVTLKILDTDGNVLFTGEPTTLTGWADWQTPSVDFEIAQQTQVKLQIEVNIQDGGWGTVDCLYLYKTGELAPEPTEPEPSDPAPTEPEPSVPATPVTPPQFDSQGVLNRIKNLLDSYREFWKNLIHWW